MVQEAQNDKANPAYWGKSAWLFLDAAISEYPIHPTEEDKRYFREFMLALPYVLPCAKCRKHTLDFYGANPITDEIVSTRSFFSIYFNKLRTYIDGEIAKERNATVSAPMTREAVVPGPVIQRRKVILIRRQPTIPKDAPHTIRAPVVQRRGGCGCHRR